VKAIGRLGWRFGFGQLPKARFQQAAIAFEDLPLWSDHRPSSDSGEFIVAIRFVKISNRDTQTAQTIQAVKELSLIGDTDDHKMRMVKLAWKKGFADFENGVARLDDLLRERQIGADKNVDVWSAALRELHRLLPSHLRLENYSLHFPGCEVGNFGSLGDAPFRCESPRLPRLLTFTKPTGLLHSFLSSFFSTTQVSCGGRLRWWPVAS
jgi:hypothetical protein